MTNDETILRGGCACGACRFELDTTPSFIANCHCKDCQRASGGAMATFAGVPTANFHWLAGEAKAFHYVAASGKKLARNFCPTCGARLYTSDLESFPGMVFVGVGSLDEPARIAPVLEMFTSRRLPWTKELALPQFPEMPH